tara:strand:+ start:279 stop:542 length:264 start_codon:yes stop_codon:yes gene_type:complete
MKKILLLLFIATSINGYTQKVDSLTKSKIKIVNDSIEFQKLKTFGNAHAKEMATMSKEYRDWFKKTFVRKRGTFTVPKEPIQPPPKY